MASQSDSKATTAQTQVVRPAGVGWLGVLLRRREIAVLGLILFISLTLMTLTPHFTNKANIKVVTDTIAPDMLITIGLTLVLLTAGIDVSVGSVLGLSAVVAADLMYYEHNMWLAILAAVLTGTLIGAINGFFIAVVRVNPLITTLAMMVAVRGAAIARTRGFLVGNFPEQFKFFGQGSIGPVGVPILIALIFFAVFYVLLNYTSFFQQAYFVGGNEKAARMSGVRIQWVKFVIYVISGALAGCAGIITLSRTMVGTSQMGLQAEFRAIPAAVIGGASLMGGEGNLIGPMLGVLLLALINDALVLMGVSAYYQALAQGLILLAAVSLDSLLHRGETRS